MRKRFLGMAFMTFRAASLAALGALAGCAATLPPVEATRFHLGQTIEPGSVAVVAIPDPKSIEMQGYVAAVEAELTRLGFTIAPVADARYSAGLELTRGSRPSVSNGRAPVSIGIGGSTGSYGSGLGLGVGFNLGGGKSGEATVTQLAVQIKQASDGSVVWEGRARITARASSAAAQPGLAAGKLAAALFKDFPGESGRTISVP